MSRVIKFRAWHKGANQMLESRDQGYQGEVFKWSNEGQPIEIMQFTGLLDKNGKEIFEGDVLNATVDGGSPFGTMTFIVEFLDGAFQLLNINDSSDGYFFIDVMDDSAEVIGNAYEH
jgi:uncharacterized phage protein (TIGR01671 family)